MVLVSMCKKFKGTMVYLNKNGFDGHGNFNFGLQEQLMFPEVQFDDIIKNHLRKEKKNILEKLNSLAKKHSKPAKISLNIYNIMMSINYPKLKAELSERFDKLE